MRAIALLSLSLLVPWGCAAQQVQKCLETPVSNKVSDDSVEQCRQALKSNMDRRDLFHRYVALLRVRGRHDDVVRWSNRVLKHDSDRTDALYNLAYGLRKIGNCEQALKKYRSYAERNKDDPDPHWLEVILFHGHPPISERLALAESPDPPSDGLN